LNQSVYSFHIKIPKKKEGVGLCIESYSMFSGEEEVLLNPPSPNEELKKAADEYERRGELLAEIIKNDEELGLYNEPFDNPLIKEDVEVINENKSLTAKLGELKKNGYKVSQLEEEEITTENTIEPTSPEKEDEKKK
jgi:hypothetical protein